MAVGWCEVKSPPSVRYGVGEGAGFLYTWPPDVLICPFVGVGDAAGAVVVAVVPWF